MPQISDFREGQQVRVLDIIPHDLMSQFGGQIGTVVQVQYPNTVQARVPHIRTGQMRLLVFNPEFLEILNGVSAQLLVIRSRQLEDRDAIVGIFTTMSAINEWVRDHNWLGMELRLEGSSINAYAERLEGGYVGHEVMAVENFTANQMLNNTSISGVVQPYEEPAEAVELMDYEEDDSDVD